MIQNATTVYNKITAELQLVCLILIIFKFLHAENNNADELKNRQAKKMSSVFFK